MIVDLQFLLDLLQFSFYGFSISFWLLSHIMESSKSISSVFLSHDAISQSYKSNQGNSER
jgi:hypothetical protein